MHAFVVAVFRGMAAGLICECIAYFAALHKSTRNMCESLCVAAVTVTVAFFSRNLYPECPALNELFFFVFFLFFGYFYLASSRYANFAFGSRNF